jgi:hypothetical protein
MPKFKTVGVITTYPGSPGSKRLKEGEQYQFTVKNKGFGKIVRRKGKDYEARISYLHDLRGVQMHVIRMQSQKETERQATNFLKSKFK